jgi:hypothetical protein
VTAPFTTNGATQTSPAFGRNSSDKASSKAASSDDQEVTLNRAGNLSDEAKKQLVSLVKNEYDKMKSNRQRIRRQWDINLEMYGGNQFIQQLTGINNAVSRIGTPNSPKSRARSVTNRIRPMIRTEITKLTSQKPTVTIIPASGEDDDLFAAQAGEAVWEFMYDHYNMQWIMERNAFWTAITGNGFIKTWWDSTKKDTLFRNVLGVATVGNIQYGNVTPYNLFVPDLLCEDVEDQPHVYEAYTRPVEWANRFFGGDFKPSIVAKTEIFESNYFQMAGENDSIPDSVLIIEAYIKPGSTKLLKEGGLVTICSDQLVNFVEGMWYSHEEYPYAHTKHIMTGKFYGASVLEDVNSLQREYNRTRSQIIESKNRMARPQLLAPIGSMDVSKYTAEPGLIIQYKPALGEPKPLALQPIPQYVLQEVERIISDMEDISGQHQVSRGMSPGQGVVAATAIAFLQEKDDAILSTTISSVEQTTAKVARQGLTLAVDYWDIPRLIRVAGMDRAFDTYELKGSDIANSLDVRVEPGSGLPNSKAARQAFLMDLFQAGAITPQQMLDMMEIGGVQSLVDRMRIDMRCAQRENLRMKQLTPQSIALFNLNTMEAAIQGMRGTVDPQRGLPTVDPANMTTYPPVVPVNKWDAHDIHITTHNNYRKSQEFDMLPIEVKDQFEKHISIHESYVFMSQQNPAFGVAQQGAPQNQLNMLPQANTGPVGPGGPNDPNGPGMGNAAGPGAGPGSVPPGGNFPPVSQPSVKG